MGSRTWTDETLDALRLVGDGPADTIVARYFEERAANRSRHLIHHLVAAEHLPEEHRSPVVHAYLEARPPLPDWVDDDALRRGEEFFLQWGLLIGMLHYYASLPSTYAMANGVKVLHLTARLASDTGRRIHETAQMIVHAMAPGGLAVGAPGYQDARRVRLMHAAVRHLILTEPVVRRACDPSGGDPIWCDDWGVPLNQEDMLATLLTFTEVVFDGLRHAGVSFSEEDAAGYLHAWSVAGHLLGVRSDLLPLTLAEAPQLWATIRRRQHAPSPEGREMTAALLRLLESHTPERLRGLHAAQMRYFLDDERADMLAVNAPGSGRLLFGGLRRVASFISLTEQHHRMVRGVSIRLGRAAFAGLLRSDRTGDRSPFTIPTHLARRWDLPATN